MPIASAVKINIDATIKSGYCIGVGGSMAIIVKRENLKRIDREKKVVEFDKDARHGKITGSRFLSVLGRDKYNSEFKTACLIARVFYDDSKNKFTIAGEIIEPIMRSYIRENRDTILRGLLDLKDEDSISVEEPVNAKDCYYDHFRKVPVFGGMVDGYIVVNGRRAAVLEIKTTGSRSDWFDENGNVIIPEGYRLQASLYAQLSKLERIVFAAAFLEEADYLNPENFVPTKDNTLFTAIEKKDITEEMRIAEEWYNKYIKGGVTPEWSDMDEAIVDVLTSDRISEMPGDAQMLFRKYAKYYDSDEDLTDLEYTIMDLMSSAASDGADKVLYEQNGLRFTLILEGVPKLEVTRI